MCNTNSFVVDNRRFIFVIKKKADSCPPQANLSGSISKAVAADKLLL